MMAMTDDEVRAFTKKHGWATRLRVDAESRNLYYDNAESSCIELKFPESLARYHTLLDLRHSCTSSARNSCKEQSYE
jgi:hypothetical protein